MADIPASQAEIGVTTGPIRGSRKIHVGPLERRDARDRSRSRRAASRRLRVYDTSGPYTDPNARSTSTPACPQLRRAWIVARGDVESYDAREIRPEDNGQLGPDRSRRRPALPQRRQAARCAPRPARTSARCTMPAAASSPPRWNMSPPARISAARCCANYVRDGEGFGASHPRLRHPRIRPRRGRPRPRDHPQQHQPPRIRADGDRPQLPGQDQRQYRQLRGRQRTSPPRSTRWSGRSAGARTR